MRQSFLLGLRLDGVVHAGDALQPVGPRGFLEFLELHTGTWSLPVPVIERVGAFLSVLQTADKAGGIPYYSASFKADPVGTARVLLGWLDSWELHGWDGVIPVGLPPRLAQLASLTKGFPLPSEGRRLCEVEAAIRQGMVVPLATLELLDGLAAWPEAWRRVLSLLPHSVRETTATAPAGTDLGTLQRSLLGSPAIDPDLDPSGTGHFLYRGDGTLRLHSTGSVLAAARLAAELNGSSGSDCFVLADRAGPLWDEASLSQGLARPGCSLGDPSRPALQLLPLALSLCVEPVSLEGMLAFLTHPFCPLGYQGGYFASAIAADGGVGGPKWKGALDKARDSEARYGGDGTKIEGKLAEWLPRDKVPAEEVPLELIQAVTARVQTYLRGRTYAPRSSVEDPDRTMVDTALESAMGQCSLFLRVLDRLAAAWQTLPLAVIQSLLSAASSSAGNNPEGQRELGSCPWSADPGSLARPVSQLYWLLPEREAGQGVWPWSRDELAALESCGLCLPTVSALNASATREWIRALCLASGSLQLILPPPGHDPHPLSLLLAALKVPVEPDPAELLLSRPGRQGSSGIVPFTLPVRRRWWHTGLDLSPLPDRCLSFSQVDMLLARPMQWVLRYKADIKTGDILSVPDRSTLAGSFAHALVEDLVDRFGTGVLTLDQGGFDRWFDAAFQDYLVRQGTSWLEAGAMQDRLQLDRTLRRSIRRLLQKLGHTGLASLETEKALTGSLAGWPFQGHADLVLVDGQGRHGIIDMKKSHWITGYRQKLEEDRDIQLSIYAELYRQETGVEAEAAYYLLPVEALVARDTAFFMADKPVEGASTSKQRLARLEASLAWRLGQLASGRIELACEATEGADDASPPLEEGLVMAEAHDDFDPYCMLYGWS
jgi:hypothetical protein